MATTKGYDQEKLQVDELANSGASSVATNLGIDEKAFLRKLDRKILPGVITLYLLSFLDRSNVANARVEGLATDLHMTGNQYLTGLTLFFVGYIMFEVPFNIILRSMSPKLFLPTCSLVFGIVTTLQGVVHNLTGFLVVRYFLGVAEGALFPGVVFYLSMWYRRTERQYRVAMFFSAASLAGAFGGILAWGIGHMNNVGGFKNSWPWIFILEGIFTCVVSIAGYYFISDYPAKSAFLNDNERAFVEQRLAIDRDLTTNEGFTWSNVTDALKDYKVWLYAMAFHTMSLPLYTLSLFLPTIILDLGYTAAAAQLLTIPPYVLATILTVAIAIISEKSHRRAPFIMCTSSLAIIGYIILLTNTGTHTKGTGKTATVVYNRPGVSYVGMFFCAAGIYPSTALVLSWPAVNVSGATKRAVAGGLQITIGNLGAVIGTQLYRSTDGPRFVRGHATALGYLVGNVVVAGSLWVFLQRENKNRDKRVESGEKEVEEWKGDEDLRWRFTS